MNYIAIKYNDVANGPGVRISLFVSGCTNHCKDCFNKETWDFNYGNKYDWNTEMDIIDNLLLPRYRGLTILGGEPMEIQNQQCVLSLIEHVKHIMPNKDVWIYTGFQYEDLQPGGKRYIDVVTNRILSLADVLVDGKFETDLYDISLKFRGSSNQRIIDLKKSTPDNIVLLDI